MSTTAPMRVDLPTRVLLLFWARPELSMQEILRATLAPLPDVQHAIELLQKRRCLIERTPTTLRLVSTGLPCWSDVLEAQAFKLDLRLGRRVMVFQKTASTSDVAWQCVGSPDCDGLVVVADEQTAGRGRLGHGWSAKAEQSILMSICLHSIAGASVDRLTLLAGLAAAEAIERAFAAGGGEGEAARVEIKWPNDLIMGGKKVAGILVERKGDQVVVGVGLNVAQGAGDFPLELEGRATSIYAATGRLIDRLRIAATLLERLDARLKMAVGDEAWVGEWKARCAMLGKRVTVRGSGGGAEKVVTGEILDIDPLQGMVVRDGAGGTHFLSAQTSTLS